MKNKNISIVYEKGVESEFITEPTDDLKLPRLVFKKQEEAEFVVAMAKLLKAHGVEDIGYEVIRSVPFAFRILNIKNNWTG